MCLRARKWTQIGWIFSAANKANVTITWFRNYLSYSVVNASYSWLGQYQERLFSCWSFFEIFLSKLVKTASVFLFTLSPLRCSFNQLKCNFSNLKPLQSSLERCWVFEPCTREPCSCLAWLLLYVIGNTNVISNHMQPYPLKS